MLKKNLRDYRNKAKDIYTHVKFLEIILILR